MVTNHRFVKPARLLSVVLVYAVLMQFVVAGQLAKIDVAITSHLGDQQTFIEGDSISFLLTLSGDAYVYLFYRDADSHLFQIFPNQHSQSHFYEKGFFMPLPPPKVAFKFRIQPPFGDENLLVFVSDNADVKLPVERLDNGLMLITAPIGDIETEIRQQSSLYFGSAEMPFSSQPR